MRKIYNIYVLLVAVVAMAFTSCQGDDNNLDTSNRRGATTFTANFDASRSYFGEKVDGAYPSYWSGDERVMLEIIDSESLSIRPSESIAMDIVDEDGKYASFTATIEQEFNGGSVYAYVPAASWEYGTDWWGISSYYYKLPTTQTPTATSVDPAAHILRAEYSFEGALPTDVDLTFEHVAAYGKLSIPALEGEDVQSVQIDLTSSWGTEYSYTLNVSELDEPTYWFACESDVIMAIGITAVTADKSYTYERTFESGSEVFFSIGHVRPLTVAGELIDPSQPEPTYPNCEIHYTATAKVEADRNYPWSFDTFGANVVSHEWDSESGEGVITFDTDVTTIGNFAFQNCDSLTSITIPDSVTKIGDSAFTYCRRLTSITIPDSVTTIGDDTFYSCSSLTSITIPDSVTTIGSYAFSVCSNLTSITIPDSVTTIGGAAFDSCTNLVEFNGKFASEDGRCLIVDSTLNSFAIGCGATEYTIPDSVTKIGDSAFCGCDSLTNITIPDSVTKIGVFAFRDCDSLTSITIPDSVTTIGNSAFGSCDSLTSVTIGDSVTTIGDWAFRYCDSLTSITIPDSVTTIGDYAFEYCDSLTSVYCEATTPPSLGGSSVFDDNASGRKIYVPAASVEAYKTADYWSEYADAIVGYDFESGEVVEPEGNEANRKIHYTATAKVEMDWTFDTFGANIVSNEWDSESEEGLITFDADVTTIGEWAFDSCSSLTSITIPDSVTTIGEKAFFNCDSLTSVTIGDSVTTIGEGAFFVCYSLTSITIPDSVTTIGYYAFFDCDSLTSITIPDSVTTIGGGAFAYCDSLTSVTIGDSVTEIGYEAFRGCGSLTSVTIPDSVTTIGDYAFAGCSLTSGVYCKATTPPSLGGSAIFDDNAYGRKIYVPEESVRQYKIAERWSEYADYIIGYDFENGVVVEPEVSINNVIHYTATAKVEAYSIYPWSFGTFGANVLSHDFNEESGEGVITFDADVLTIGKGAFYYCDSLTSITIPDSVMTIGDNAFDSCSSLTEFNGKFASEDGRCLIVDGTLNSFAPAGLTSYTIPDSVTTIGDYAFAGCSLTSVTIPDSVTTIGDYAFAGCSLTSVTIGDSVTTIGEWAFSDCDNLTGVTIPDSVTTIGDYAFANCRSLTSVTIPDSVTTIGTGAFYYCGSLTSVTIPDSVTTIGEYAFYSCGLTSVTIPDSVTTIGFAAFGYCTSLTSVTIPDSVTTIGGFAFQHCDKLTSVTIGDSVTTIGDWAFNWCSSLTSVTIPDSVTTIGDWAFYECYSLTSVYCEATTPPSLGGSSVFDYNASGRTIYVPAASVEAYKTAGYWSEYADAIVGNGPTPEDTPITDISSPSLKAGDFVSLNGVLGIVYYNDSSVVKVMSVETTTCEWGLYGTSVGATDPDDGRVNVETVKANGCFDFLPGFVWCESLGEGWYFPTIVEMIELYDAKETMNASLSAYGYPQFEGYYWASSEYSSTDAAQFIAASCQWSSCSKSDATNKVCAIRVVNL